jgi:hypothetical protein
VGAGSIYNHSDQPNAHVIFDADYLVATFYACQPIAQGEEIFVNYGKDWFTGNRGIKKKTKPWWYILLRTIKRIPWRAVIVFAGTLGAIAVLQRILLLLG